MVSMTAYMIITNIFWFVLNYIYSVLRKLDQLSPLVKMLESRSISQHEQAAEKINGSVSMEKSNMKTVAGETDIVELQQEAGGG